VQQLVEARAGGAVRGEHRVAGLVDACLVGKEDAGDGDDRSGTVEERGGPPHQPPPPACPEDLPVRHHPG